MFFFVFCFFLKKDSSGLQVPLELITNSSCKAPHGGTPGAVSRLTSSVFFLFST